MEKNRPLETIPCPNIRNTDPERESELHDVIPSTHIFMCAMDEYAIIRFMSIWRSVDNDAKKIDTMAKSITIGL